MLRIPCPYCGKRDENEFVFGGPAHVSRTSGQVDDATWTAYLYSKENTVGIQFERWAHMYGCGRWFNLARNTTTHAILRSYPLSDPKPDVSDQ